VNFTHPAWNSRNTKVPRPEGYGSQSLALQSECSRTKQLMLFMGFV